MSKSIEFSIGPSNELYHDKIIDWLLNRKSDYVIVEISNEGDHYSEIHVHGDYDIAYKAINEITKYTSFEHWENN